MVGSAAGNMAIPNNATYAATRLSSTPFSESLRGEVARQVHVTLLAPGPVRTTHRHPRTNRSSTRWSRISCGTTRRQLPR